MSYELIKHRKLRNQIVKGYGDDTTIVHIFEHEFALDPFEPEENYVTVISKVYEPFIDHEKVNQEIKSSTLRELYINTAAYYHRKYYYYTSETETDTFTCRGKEDLINHFIESQGKEWLANFKREIITSAYDLSNTYANFVLSTDLLLLKEREELSEETLAKSTFKAGDEWVLLCSKFYDYGKESKNQIIEEVESLFDRGMTVSSEVMEILENEDGFTTVLKTIRRMQALDFSKSLEASLSKNDKPTKKLKI
ncbi:hypothetical protein [Diaphorobacter aerolatus]|uniref:Uncharacterized protein n=1 Tax=Diaphorobacter aerolatus TaxID=1288495 RepID=A0A7H0GJD5_9BURK|nr:hypothetical protein [Diaphorobacter aerolatus]QNP48401.1 hypothetical protein H9K75_21000 [Diaphorobacter aerolatus]